VCQGNHDVMQEEHHFLMDQLTPRSFDEIYNRVVEYIDFLIDKVNPQKLLFISVDGVVPRAKVNQSR
jgi:5'-3' exonuclease